MPQSSETHKMNSAFFNGHYKNIWKQIFPEKTTLAEVLFIQESGNLSNQSYVLDLMCGYGRHTIELAKRGINVTAVDILSDYVSEIKETAIKLEINIDAIEVDVLQLQLNRQFDAILCMGNSIQFFNHQEIQQFFKTISNHLSEEGFFIINTWFILEIILKDYQPRSWSRYKGMIYINESTWLFHPSRVETKSIIITDDGDKETNISVDFIYSLGEIEHFLEEAGLFIETIFSIPGKKTFSIGDVRAYIIVRKSKLKNN